MQTLTIEQILEVVKLTPEKAVFDWKRDFVPPVDDYKRGEFLKDVSAIANACTNNYGLIIYGVDPRTPELVVGTTVSYDDAKLQQLAQGKIQPVPEFLYYELMHGARRVAVVQIAPSQPRPHIINVNMGGVRKGQILVRRGTSTDGVTIEDLYRFFYGKHSSHFPNVIQQMNAHANQQNAQTAYLRELRAQADNALRDMEIISGVKLPR
jgi:predicted HTH transcriptional regulator